MSLPHLAIPTYFTTASDWATLLATPNAIGLVLVNPSSGPGTAVDPTYTAIVARIRTADIRALGYVSTRYGARPLAEVLADMDRYRSMYGISSFFFDETPNVCSEVVGGTQRDYAQYYGQLYMNAHTTTTATAVLNPGTNVPQCFLPVSDVIVTFEASAATYATWAPDPWTASVSADHFWHLVYSVPAADRAATVVTAATRHAGYLYATTDGMPNPWAGLGDPGSFASMRSATLGGRVPAPTVSAAPPATRLPAVAIPVPSTTLVGGAARATDVDTAVNRTPVVVDVVSTPTSPTVVPTSAEPTTTNPGVVVTTAPVVTTVVPVVATTVVQIGTRSLVSVPPTPTSSVPTSSTTAVPAAFPVSTLNPAPTVLLATVPAPTSVSAPTIPTPTISAPTISAPMVPHETIPTPTNPTAAVAAPVVPYEAAVAPTVLPTSLSSVFRLAPTSDRSSETTTPSVAVTMPPIRVPVVSVDSVRLAGQAAPNSWTAYGHSDGVLVWLWCVIFGDEVFAH